MSQCEFKLEMLIMFLWCWSFMGAAMAGTSDAPKTFLKKCLLIIVGGPVIWMIFIAALIMVGYDAVFGIGDKKRSEKE